MSKSIANGLSIDLPMPAGESIKLGWLGGTYSLQIVAGAAALPVSLSSNSAANQSFGPYALGVVLRLTVSAIGRVEYNVGTTPAFRPPGEVFVRQDDGISVRLTGVGAAAAFTEDGGGSSVPSAASGIQAFKPMGPPAADGFAAGRTIQTSITCKRTFTGVRLMFCNLDTVTPLTISAKAVPSPTLANDGAALTWSTVTFAGATSVVIPVASTVNGQTVPAYVQSDLLPIQSVARTDSGKVDPVLLVRSYSVGTQYPGGYNTAFAYHTVVGVEASHANGSGDRVTSTTAMTAIGASLKQINFTCATFYTGGKVLKMTCHGDSVTAGSGTEPASWVSYLSGALQAAGYPMTVANFGQSGQLRDVSSAILQAVTPLLQPDLVIIFNMSVNSPLGTQAQQDAQTGSVWADIEAAKAVGAKVAVVTMHSQGGFAARATAYMQGWGILLDMNAIINPAIHTTDGTHLNALGAQVFGEYANPKIITLLGTPT